MNPAERLRYFQNRQSEMIEMIREIVEIESPSRDVDRSREVVAWIEGKAREIDLDISIERVPAEICGDHLILRAFSGAGKSILLLGHTDTVHPVGTKEQNPTRIDGEKMFGCGIFDMKSGIVLMLEALRCISSNGEAVARPVSILLSCDEEIGSASGRALVEREAANAEACLVFEPSAAGKVKTGRKGTGMFTVKTWGVPAHAGLEPERGASAILELAKQIEKIHTLGDASKGTTVNVCTMRGGTTTNVIPEHAECTVDVRFTSAAEADRVASEITSLSPFDDRVKILVTGGVNRPPLERTDGVASLFEKAKNAAAQFDYDLSETQVGGASDGNFVAALGVPVLDGLGIAGDGAHRLDEHILIDDIAKRATLVTSLLLADA